MSYRASQMIALATRSVGQCKRTGREHDILINPFMGQAAVEHCGHEVSVTAITVCTPRSLTPLRLFFYSSCQLWQLPTSRVCFAGLPTGAIVLSAGGSVCAAQRPRVFRLSASFKSVRRYSMARIHTE